MPTEAEWEYAARAYDGTAFAGSNVSEDVAWTAENSASGPQPVAGLAPNGFGLYDMSGNVWEWVQDCWNDSYRGAPTNGSAWTGGNCGKRVLRGGSWNNVPAFLRSANRNGNTASNRYSNYGFRLVQDL